MSKKSIFLSICSLSTILCFKYLTGEDEMLYLDNRPVETMNQYDCASLQTQTKWKGRIVVLWSGLGEFAWAKRLENACRNLGWLCRTSIDPAELSDYDRLVQDRASTPEEIQDLIQQIDPDCVISLKWDRIYSKTIPNYLSASGVFKRVSNPSLDSSIYHNERSMGDLLAFNGILHTVGIEPLKEFFESSGKRFHSMEWYPSSTATDYQPVEHKALFYCGFQWDSKRNGAEYRKMFSLLDQQGGLNIYGPVDKWDCAPNSVKGMTFDENEFRLAMRESGIVLVLHTQGNLDQGAPAARVFEAAAACCVIISDMHPFIIKEFGDSILYVDHTQPGEILFQQIEDHRKWILEHPIEAEAMARKAHSIFFSKFTLERQLETFKEFHLHVLEELDAH